MTTADPYDTLGALLRHDFGRYEESLPTVDPRQFAVAMTAAFTLAADRRFGHGQSATDIAEFVTGTRTEFPEIADQLDLEAAQRILRTVALGEDNDLTDIDEKVLGRVESLLLLPLLEGAPDWDETKLAEFLSEARTLSAQWTTT